MRHAARNWSQFAETSRQLRRFLVVGVLCVLVDLGAYYMLSVRLGINADRAKAISYLVGVVIGFALNKWWTFESARRSWTEPASYLLLYLVTLIVNVSCNRLALEMLGEDGRLIAYFFATGVTTVLNFVGMRLVTFRRGVAERCATKRVASADKTPLRKAG